MKMNVRRISVCLAAVLAMAVFLGLTALPLLAGDRGGGAAREESAAACAEAVPSGEAAPSAGASAETAAEDTSPEQPGETDPASGNTSPEQAEKEDPAAEGKGSGTSSGHSSRNEDEMDGKEDPAEDPAVSAHTGDGTEKPDHPEAEREKAVDEKEGAGEGKEETAEAVTEEADPEERAGLHDAAPDETPGKAEASADQVPEEKKTENAVRKNEGQTGKETAQSGAQKSGEAGSRTEADPSETGSAEESDPPSPPADEAPPTVTIIVDPPEWEGTGAHGPAGRPSQKHAFSFTADDSRDENGQERELYTGIRKVEWSLWKAEEDGRLEAVEGCQNRELFHAEPQPSDPEEAGDLARISSEAPVELDGTETGLCGTYRLTLEAEDVCGNRGTAQADLVFDGVAPEAVISADGGNRVKTGSAAACCYQSGNWKNQYIIVTDRYEIGSVTVTAENENNGRKREWKYVDPDSIPEGVTVNAERTSVEIVIDGASELGDGCIVLTVRAEDVAGNVTCGLLPDSARSSIGFRESGQGGKQAWFLHDNTPPVSRMQMTGGRLYGGGWYYRADNCGIRIRISDVVCPVYSFQVTLRSEDGQKMLQKELRGAADGSGTLVTRITGKGEKTESCRLSGEITLPLSQEEVLLLRNGRLRLQMETEDAAGNRTDLFGQEEGGKSFQMLLSGNPLTEAGAFGDEAVFLLDTAAPSVETGMLQEGKYYADDPEGYYYRADNCGLRIRLSETGSRGIIGAYHVSVCNEDTDRMLEQEMSGSSDSAESVLRRRIAGEDEVNSACAPGREMTAVFSEKEVRKLGDGRIRVRVTAEDPAGNITRLFGKASGMKTEKGTNGESVGGFVLDMTDPVVTAIRTGAKGKGETAGGTADARPYEDGRKGSFYYYNDAAVETEFAIEEKNPEKWQVSYERDGKRTGGEDSWPSAGGPDEGEASGTQYIRIRYSFGKVEKDRAAEGRYTKISVRGMDKAGNPLHLQKDRSGKTTCRYTGKGKNEVDAAQEVTDDGGNGVITLKTGKVIDRTPPVASLTYQTDAAVWLYDGINAADGSAETDSGHYSIATAYTNQGFSTEVRISDQCGSGSGAQAAALDPARLTVKQYGKQAAELTSAGGMHRDGTFQGSLCVAADRKSRTDGGYYYKVFGTDRAGNALCVREGFSPDTKTQRIPVLRSYETKGCSGTYHAKFRIVLDTVSPVFTFSMEDPKGRETVDGTTAYYGSTTKKLRGSFFIREENLDPERVRTGTVFRAENSVSRYDRTQLKWNDAALAAERFRRTGKVFSAVLDNSGEGICRFAVSGCDKAGNPLLQSAEEKAKKGFGATTKAGTGSDSGRFWTWHKVLDRTAPEGILEIGNGQKSYYHVDLGRDGVNTLAEGNGRYAPYRKERKAFITVESGDLSPVCVTWRIVSTVKGQNREFSEPEYQNDQRASATVTGEQIFHVSGLTLTDRAGNRSGFIRRSFTEANSIYLDVTPPVSQDLDRPSATVTASGKNTKSSADGRELFNRGIDLKIRVVDPNENVMSSGLEHVTYIVRADGKTVLRQTISGEKEIDGKKFRTGPAPLYGSGPLDYEFEKTIHLAAGGIYETNGIEVEVNAADNAGNTAETTVYRCGIDTQGPEITVRFDNNSARNDLYFKDPRTAVVEVKDRNIDDRGIIIRTQGEISGSFQNTLHAGNGSGDLWEKKISFSKDGEYTLEVSGTDALGNRAAVHYTGTAPQRFTIDRTPPEISISFDREKGWQGSRYYPAARIGTVGITEKNFRESDVKINVSGSVTGAAGSAKVHPAVGAWQDSGNLHTRRYDFTEDGDYALNVSCTDLAGNEAQPCAAEPFTVDTTKPEIAVIDESVRDGAIYTGVIAPRIRFKDDHYDPDGVSFTITGRKGHTAHKFEREEVLEDGTGYGGWISYPDFPARRGSDDVYTAVGKITDRAGNTSELTLTFSVNRFGSTFDYNSDRVTESFIHSCRQRGMDLYLREINVSEIVSREVYLSRETEFVRLTEGEDYEVTCVQEPDSFPGNTYVYRFFAKNFLKEGCYDVMVQSVDLAGHHNTNAGFTGSRGGENSVPLSFVIDRTNPTVSLRNADPRCLYWQQDSLQVGIAPEDGVKLDRVYVWLNDRLTGVWFDPEDDYVQKEGEYPLTEVLNENNGTIPFTFENSMRPQHLHVEAVDTAGNRSTLPEEVLDWSPVVSASPLVQFYNRKGLLYGSFAAVLILAVLYCLLRERHQKGIAGKKSEKNSAQKKPAGKEDPRKKSLS